jgi:hypothetical protein
LQFQTELRRFPMEDPCQLAFGLSGDRSERAKECRLRHVESAGHDLDLRWRKRVPGPVEYCAGIHEVDSRQQRLQSAKGRETEPVDGNNTSPGQQIEKVIEEMRVGDRPT